ncbi:MAG: hypothetical protein M3337_08605 [Actinomycetota bacterium]|nr:hypothetical protein [Actinomycetota bacterium]
MRILVTNDDGIDSVGLHVLARSMLPLGEVVVVAPDREYSGCSAAIGSLQQIEPELRVADIDGIDESWSLSGAPALCVFLARLGVFGAPFDLVVAGINPGANVGRAVYHSGTVGAALTARNSAMSGVAVSQSVTDFGVEGQGWNEMLADMKWDTAGAVANIVVGALVSDMPDEPVVINVNVPNVELDAVKGWRHCVVGTIPPRTIGRASRHPIIGQEGAYSISMSWGEAQELPPDTDGGTVERQQVAITYLGPLQDTARSDLGAVDQALESFLADTGTAGEESS